MGTRAGGGPESTMDTNNLIESIDARAGVFSSLPHVTSLCSSFLFKFRSFVSPVLSGLFATLSLFAMEGRQRTEGRDECLLLSRLLYSVKPNHFYVSFFSNKKDIPTSSFT